MSKLIVGTFLILGWTFYELSDGSEFVPEERVVAGAELEEAVVEVAAIEPVVEEPVVEVTRAAAVNLLDLTAPAVSETPAIAEPEDSVAEVLASLVAEVPEIEEIVAPALDIRVVSGSRVNMRSGPGTNYGVLETLDGGTEAEVIEVDATGWARIRIVNTDQIGWMAERLLTES